MIRNALFASIILSASSAWGCSEPYTSLSLPSPPGSFSKPDVPYCLSSYRYSGSHSCEDWELSSYQSDVEEYVEKLQSYASEAADIARKAVNYAQEAEEYARCEAAEVANQHE